MKKNSIGTLFVLLALLTCFTLPSVTSAAGLTDAQASAIVGLLQAFNAEQSVIANVMRALGLSSSSLPASAVTPVDPPPAATPTYNARPLDSAYPQSSIGYDLSFNTTAYPVLPFGFGVVGVTRGKAFVDNPRLASEYSWARLASAARPTMYMNLNAPYGSTVAGNIGSPKTCLANSSTEPTACEGYNYGYNAAKESFAYAQANSIPLTVWWLDIEEANSWSSDTSVNDATIQGAIDYLNAQGIRVGVYSTPYMWQEIAGSGFTPTEKVNGETETVPTWFPIGVTTQIGAANTCLTGTTFIPGSPIWMVQFESSSTAIDQNIAC